MEKHISYSARQATQSSKGSSLATLLTLSSWRLRQTWWLLLLTGISLLAAFAIACIAPLFSSIATDAGLQGLLNGTPTRSTLSLTTQNATFSTKIVQQTYQGLDRVIRANMGTYLNAQAPLTIEVVHMQIVAPAALQNTNPMNLYAAPLESLEPSLRLVAGQWAGNDVQNGVIDIMLSAETAVDMGLHVGQTLTLQGGFVTKNSPALGDPRNVLHVRLAGTFAVARSDAAALSNISFRPELGDTGRVYSFLMSNNAFFQFCTQIASNEQSSEISTSVAAQNIFNLTWNYQLRSSQIDFEHISDFTSHLANAQYAISTTRPGTQFYNPAPGGADIVSLLNQYTNRVASVNLPITLLAIQIIALLLFFAALLINLIVDRQATMNAQFSGRGASQRQLIWSLVAQGVILCVLALVL